MTLTLLLALDIVAIWLNEQHVLFQSFILSFNPKVFPMSFALLDTSVVLTDNQFMCA